MQNADLTEKRGTLQKKVENIMKFGKNEIQEQKFHQYKEPISIKNIDINKIVVSNKIFCSKKRYKYFIDQKDARKSRPSCEFISKMSACRKD